MAKIFRKTHNPHSLTLRKDNSRRGTFQVFYFLNMDIPLINDPPVITVTTGNYLTFLLLSQLVSPWSRGLRMATLILKWPACLSTWSECGTRPPITSSCSHSRAVDKQYHTIMKHDIGVT